MTDTRESLGLPWEQEDWDIVDQRGRDVADVTSQDRAAFIVTACNSHHDLVEAASPLASFPLTESEEARADDFVLYGRERGWKLTVGDVKAARTALHKAKRAPHESE